MFTHLSIPMPSSTPLATPQGYSKSSFLRNETVSLALNTCKTRHLYS